MTKSLKKAIILASKQKTQDDTKRGQMVENGRQCVGIGPIVEVGLGIPARYKDPANRRIL